MEKRYDVAHNPFDVHACMHAWPINDIIYYDNETASYRYIYQQTETTFVPAGTCVLVVCRAHDLIGKVRCSQRYSYRYTVELHYFKDSTLFN